VKRVEAGLKRNNPLQKKFFRERVKEGADFNDSL
jgi:hypothetical protein